MDRSTPSTAAVLFARLIAVVQAAIYVGTGVWSLVSIETFQAVTGPKCDIWLVKTVGVLVIVTGAVLTFAAVRNRVGPEVVLLAVGNALGLAAIDITYVSLGRIPPIYLADAAGELVLVAAWMAVCRAGACRGR